MQPTARNKHLLLWSSLASLALLVWAAYDENARREWRRLQHAAASPAGPVEVHLRQVVVPPLRLADRCVSCHVGMAAGEATLPGDPVLKPHPEVGHDPGSFGCTSCHAGQGRATDRADAHGEVHFWPRPMIPRRHAQAGCGSCHTHLQVPNLGALRAGAAALERHDCLACHRLDGRGGTLRPDGSGMEGPDLSRVGARGYREDWYEDHLARRAGGEAGPWAASFGEIPAADRAAIAVLLGSTVGAPRLVEAKALFHSRGCRGCHKVGGVGGDDGPDLTRIGERDPGRLDLSRVPGDPSVAGWLAEHFRAPAALVPGSRMPALGLREEEIDLLVLYMLSLRRSDVPEAYWPRDRIRAERFGEREFAQDGATLFGTFCAACHGPAGEGMRYPGMPAFPAIGNPDFLAIVPDELLTATVRQGRPGRRMPAWGEQEGGLRAEEVAATVAFVRSLGGGVPREQDPRPARWASGDRTAGAHLYAQHCALCHGAQGEGGEGPALANRVLLGAATDTYLVETVNRGRRGTLMQGFGTSSPVRPALSSAEIESIVTFIRTWEAGS
jgi:cytochrome c oxidase cbb3-type subunit 3